MKKFVAIALTAVLALSLTACGQEKTEAPETSEGIPTQSTEPLEESVWSSLPDEEGFKETLQAVLTKYSNTEIEIADYKNENGGISCHYLNGQVNFMGKVTNGKVTTCYAMTSLETFDKYKDEAGQSFLGLIIAPIALYNPDCTDGASLFAFVDTVAESRADETMPTGKLEHNGIEYTFSTEYMLSCQARYVEDMSVYGTDTEESMPPVSDPSSGRVETDDPFYFVPDEPETPTHTLSGSFDMSDLDRPCFILDTSYTFTDEIDGETVTLDRVYFYPESWVGNFYEGYSILALAEGKAEGYTVTGNLNNYRGGGDYYWEEVTIVPSDPGTGDPGSKICPECGGTLTWAAGAWMCDNCIAAY